jgi:large subunit ribosomal protein L15
MGSNGAREKALQYLREVPRLGKKNIRGLPEVPGLHRSPTPRKERKRGTKNHGWGDSARQKLYFGPLGYEAGNTPIQRKTSFERSYNYGIRFQRQFPPLSLAQIQLMIDTGRLDPSQPIDMASLCGTKVAFIDPAKNHFGFNLTSEGMDNFKAKINIEVQWTDEQSIAAVERNGGRILTSYYDLNSVIALSNPLKFFETGAPIPRRLTPPANIMEFYVSASNRGYLADPTEVIQQRLALAQKYGYELQENKDEEQVPIKDPRQIFYGLHPGWIVNLADKVIYKPSSSELKEVYES